MKLSVCLFFAAFIVFLGASDTFAQRRGCINQRQQNQRGRIANGVRSGELTARETRGLIVEQRQINRLEDRFRASGDGLSPRERARLQSELNQASRHIYRQKHDGQDYDFSRP